MSESPFKTHRNILLDHYGAAQFLRLFTLSMWNGNAFPIGLSWMGRLDERHGKIMQELFCHYCEHGENDDAFMSVARECADLYQKEKM